MVIDALPLGIANVCRVHCAMCGRSLGVHGMQYSLRPGDQLKQKCREHTLGIIKVAQNGQSVKMVFGVVAVAMCSFGCYNVI